MTDTLVRRLAQAATRVFIDSFCKPAWGAPCRLPPQILRTLPLPASYFDQKTKRHFEVYKREARLYQTEYGIDGDGQESFRDTQELNWIIGSGTNGLSAIAQRDNYLFQAPLSFYSKPGTWGPSPGYEFADYGFNRPILAGCIFCHSGRPVR